MKKFTFCVAFAALSVSAGLARSPFVLSDAVPAECMLLGKFGIIINVAKPNMLMWLNGRAVHS